MPDEFRAVAWELFMRSPCVFMTITVLGAVVGFGIKALYWISPPTKTLNSLGNGVQLATVA